MVKTPIIYLDTNFLRDVSHKRNTKSIMWMEQIRNKKWTCLTSTFGMMELLDNEQDDTFLTTSLSKRKEFNEIFRTRFNRELEGAEFEQVRKTINNFLMTYPHIKFVNIDNEGWKLALEISSNSNIFAPDAIHLAAAWTNDADLLITSDKHFLSESKKLLEKEKKWSKMRVSSPEKVKDELKGLKFGGLP
jgi:predicted nucleic acid-binding protein